MSNVIRLCHPFNFKMLFEYDGRKFTGLFASFASDLFNSMTRASNVTLKVRSEDDQAGELINGSTHSYSGCIGRLQTNQSDVMLYYTDYPHPAADISQGLVTIDTVIEMITTYRPSNQEMQLVQVEKSFDSFQPEVWLLCFITMVCSMSILLMKDLLNNWVRRMIGVKRSARSPYRQLPFEVIAQMTNHGKLSITAGFIRKTVFLLLSCFSFLVVLYLCLSMKTDLVVIAPPHTLRSYQELVDNECGVYFFAGSDYYSSFKSAAKGSLKKRLWDFSVSKYPMNVVLFSYGENMQPVSTITDAMLAGKLALITSSELSAFSMRGLCSILLNEQKANTYAKLFNVSASADHSLAFLPLVSRDKTAEVYQRGLILNAITSPPLKRLSRIVKRVYEAGIFARAQKYLTELDPSSLGQTFDRGSDTFGNMEKCMASELFMPDASYQSLTTGNWVNFPVYAVYALTCQLLVLALEVLTNLLTRILKRTRIGINRSKL